MVKVFLQTEPYSKTIGTLRYCTIKRINGKIEEHQYILHHKSTDKSYEYIGCESSYGHNTIDKRP